MARPAALTRAEKAYAEGLPTLTANEYLIAAGTFHGIHAIGAKLNPVPGVVSSGVEVIEAETFKMHCLQTPTGTKLILIASPSHPAPAAVLARLYEAYADYLKSPFQVPEMPIRSDAFDARCAGVVAAVR